MADLRSKIRHALNSASAENGSNTPDFILAEFLAECLTAFDKAVQARATWYGRMDLPGGMAVTADAEPKDGDGV